MSSICALPVLSHPGLLSCLLEKNVNLEIGIAGVKTIGKLRIPTLSFFDVLFEDRSLRLVIGERGLILLSNPYQESKRLVY